MNPFPGIDGFLGTRASVMLDFVAVAMLVIVPLLLWSVRTARRGEWQAHKLGQMLLGGVLLLAVVAFEIDMQFLTEWELRAEPSPLFDTAHKWTCPVGILLLLHLMFAIPAAVLWGVVIYRAVRNFPAPPTPGPHSAAHRRWGWLAVGETVMTAITGWMFYVTAFVMS